MVPGANVTEVGAAVEQTLKRIEQDLPVGVELGRISDQAQVVGQSIRQFLEALAEAIGIVLVVSLLFQLPTSRWPRSTCCSNNFLNRQNRL